VAGYMEWRRVGLSDRTSPRVIGLTLLTLVRPAAAATTPYHAEPPCLPIYVSPA